MAEDIYPSNSNKSKEHSLVREKTSLDDSTAVRKPLQKAEGVIKTSRPTTFKDIFKAIFPNGLSGIKENLIYDWLVPGIQTFMRNGWDGLGNAIFPKANSKPSGRTSYESAYKSSSVSYRPKASWDEWADDQSFQPRVSDFQEPIFDDVDSARRVLDTLEDQIREYHVVTLLDYNELIGLPTRPSQNNYGWTSLSTATIQRTHGGNWRLMMPRPVQLDRIR